jgi:LysM repeat protein
MEDKKKRFSWRGWTTFVLTISFIVDTISGIILYISPPGRIANWTDWRVWGLSKGEWEAVHTIFGYVILIIVFFHLYYNWKMFLNFIWSKVKKAVNLRWELITATLVSLLIFLGTLWNIPPFSSTMELGEYFKASWEESKTDTPIAHAELLSLQEFAKKINVPMDQIQNSLKAAGYRVKDPGQTLGEIAEENGIPPSKLYEAIKAGGGGSGGVKPVVPETIKGSGLGRKTLNAISIEKGIPLDTMIKKLKQKGIDAKPNDSLKNVASKYGKTPHDIFEILSAKE